MKKLMLSHLAEKQHEIVTSIQQVRLNPNLKSLYVQTHSLLLADLKGGQAGFIPRVHFQSHQGHGDHERQSARVTAVTILNATQM